MFAAASEQAFRAGDTATAIHAYAHLVYLVGTSDPAAPEGGRWRPYAEALPVVRWSAGHLTGPTSYARALLESSDGSLRLARGEPGAREAFQAALDAWTGDPEHVELFGLFANLAMVTDDAPRRDALFARAIEFLTHSLGPDHYTVLDTRLSAAMHVEHPRRAYEALGAACRELLALHAHHREPISTCHYELGWLAVALRDEAAATAAFARVTEPGPEREIARAYVAPDAASANRLAALARELAAENVPFLALRAADAGLIAARASDRSTARRVLEHGLAALDATRGFEHRAFFARRRAAVAAALARVGGPIERAREAAAFYRTAGGYEAALRELEPLTGSR